MSLQFLCSHQRSAADDCGGPLLPDAVVSSRPSRPKPNRALARAVVPARRLYPSVLPDFLLPNRLMSDPKAAEISQSRSDWVASGYGPLPTVANDWNKKGPRGQAEVDGQRFVPASAPHPDPLPVKDGEREKRALATSPKGQGQPEPPASRPVSTSSDNGLCRSSMRRFDALRQLFTQHDEWRPAGAISASCH